MAGEFLAGSIVAKMMLDRSGWTSGVNSVMADGQKMAGMSAKTAAGFRTMGSVMMVAGGAIVGAFAKMVSAAEKQNRAEAQLNAVIASTGGIAGMTAKACTDLASSLQATTTYGDEAIISAESLLLTFTKIGKDIFPEATEVVLDMSTALGQDLKSSAIQLGKALQDPILGVTALRRVGVNFDKDQQALIKTLVETGRTLDAQKLILHELGVEFGGSAKAAAQTFSGQMAQLRNELGEVGEEIGQAVIPIFRSMVESIKPIVIQFKAWLQANPELVKQIAGIALKVGGLLLALGPIVYMVPKLVSAFGMLKSAILALTSPIGILIAATIAAGVEINKLINDYKKRLDEAIAKETEYGNKLGQLHELRRQAVKEGIVTQEEWRAIVNRFGGDYEKVYKAIATMPEYAELKGKLKEIEDKQEKATDAAMAHKKASGVLKNALGDLADELKDTATYAKKYADFLASAGVKAYDPKKIKEYIRFTEDLAGEFKSGRITAEQYARGLEKANEELWDLGYYTKTAIPAARDMTEALRRAVPVFEDISYEAMTFDKLVERMAYDMDVSSATIVRELYEIQRKFLAMMGIILPEWGEFCGGISSEMKTTTDDTSHYFDGMMNDVARSMGQAFEDMLSGAKTFKEGMQAIWDSIKEAFFNMVGEMVTKWIMDFCKAALKEATADSAASAATSLTSMGTAGTASFAAMAVAAAEFLVVLASILAAIILIWQSWEYLFGGIKINIHWKEERERWLDWMKKMRERFDSLKDFREWFEEYRERKEEEEEEEAGRTPGGPGGPGGPKWQAGFEGIVRAPIRPVIGEVPEYVKVVPLSRMGAGRGGDVYITLHINGQVITDREYVRARLMPQIISALDSHEFKSKLQERLGVS